MAFPGAAGGSREHKEGIPSDLQDGRSFLEVPCWPEGGFCGGALESVNAQGLGGCHFLSQGKASHPREPQNRSQDWGPGLKRMWDGPSSEPASRVARLVCRFRRLLVATRLGDLSAMLVFPTTHGRPPSYSLGSYRLLVPKPHAALFKASESWGCGNQMEEAFSILVVTEWKSGLEVKQPEITKGLGMLHRLLEKILHKVRKEWPLKRAKGLGVWEMVIHFRGLQWGVASNSSSWVGDWAFMGGTHPILSCSLKAKPLIQDQGTWAPSQ